MVTEVQEIVYPTEEEILRMHDDLIEVSGGVYGERNYGNIGYVVSMLPYKEDDGLSAMAAFLMSRISKGHPFVDGNKRTAYFVARYFMLRNGLDFNGDTVLEASQRVEDIASRTSMDEAFGDALIMCRRTIKEQPRISDYDTFYRIVIKSIGVARILSEA